LLTGVGEVTLITEKMRLGLGTPRGDETGNCGTPKALLRHSILKAVRQEILSRKLRGLSLYMKISNYFPGYPIMEHMRNRPYIQLANAKGIVPGFR
jgi:hypothetical protein